LGPLYIFAVAEATNFKFGTQIAHKYIVLYEDASSDHPCDFVGGLATLYYKSKTAADAMLDFR